MRNTLRALAGLLTIALASSVLADTKRTLQFVYIGGAGCGFCKRPEYKKRIAEYRDAARAWAQEHHFAFESIGVATDEDKARGEQFLADSGIGPYDRTVSGRGWAGAEAFTKPYRWTNAMFLEGAPMEAAPQVALFLDSHDGKTPREVFRALGTMIMMLPEGEIAALLNRATKPKPAP